MTGRQLYAGWPWVRVEQAKRPACGVESLVSHYLSLFDSKIFTWLCQALVVACGILVKVRGRSSRDLWAQ